MKDAPRTPGASKQNKGLKGYKEASSETLALLDEQGERRQTIYLGRMPESRKLKGPTQGRIHSVLATPSALRQIGVVHYCLARFELDLPAEVFNIDHHKAHGAPAERYSPAFRTGITVPLTTCSLLKRPSSVGECSTTPLMKEPAPSQTRLCASTQNDHQRTRRVLLCLTILSS